MAVYEQTYKRYAGKLTPEWSRFLIIPRHAYRGVFNSKLFTAFFAICFIPLLVEAVLIYLHHNVTALAIMQVNVRELIPDRRFVLCNVRQHPGRFRVHPCFIDWTTTGFSRSAQQRSAALSLPSVFTHGVCDRQDVGNPDSVVSGYLGAATAVVLVSVVPRGLRVV